MLHSSFSNIIHRLAEVRTMICKRFMVLPITRHAHIHTYHCIFIFPAEQQDLHYGIKQKGKWKSQQIIFGYLRNYDMYRKQHTVK